VKAKAKGISILLVDDDEGDCRLVKESLLDSQRASTIHVVNSGDDALAHLRRGKGTPRPDVVFLDINMPGKDGFATLREIRADEDLTHLPVVMLTTSTEQRDVDESYRLHANCFVSKPTRFADFAAAVRDLEGFWADLVRLPS
jgi:CheY-like chemotaxis protein